MSFAFCDPPDSGVKVSARAGWAAIRIATAATARAAGSRRLGMPAGKAAGSYLRLRQALHFVADVPSLSRAARAEAPPARLPAGRRPPGPEGHGHAAGRPRAP